MLIRARTQPLRLSLYRVARIKPSQLYLSVTLTGCSATVEKARVAVANRFRCNETKTTITPEGHSRSPILVPTESPYTTVCLVVPRFRLSTVGSRAFNVSGPRIWNGLPEVVSAPTLSSFRRRLKVNPSFFSSHILMLSSNC